MASFVQAANTASNVASPTSLTPTFTTASKPGNFLVLAITLTGTALSITNPTNWTQVDSYSNTGILSKLLIFPNNPGGITSVAVTIADTTGGAVAVLAEFSNMGPNFSLENEANFTSAGAQFLGQVAGFSATPPETNELGFLVFGFAATSFTPGNTSDWIAIPNGAIASTNGTPNAQIASFYSISIPLGLISQTAATLGASVALTQAQARWFNSGRGSITNMTDYGSRGVMKPSFYQGTIGG